MNSEETKAQENNTEEKVVDINAAKTEAETEAKAEKQEAEESVEEKLQKELADAKAKYAYLAAELDNTRKRFAKEKEQLLKYGSEKILEDLLEVVDNLDRTVSAIKDDGDKKVKNILVGVNMVKKQFIDSLTKHGLEPLDSEGKEFDPNEHEAMAQEESADHKSNIIISVFQKGYRLNGRLLRAAKVIVSK